MRTSFPGALAEFPPFLLVRGGETIQFADTEADSVPPVNRELARLRGYRSMLFAPLMSKGAAIGMISVTRSEPGAFAADHVQLLRTFADQAVIAIENVRLFDEVQARTKDLQEALQQQTATANVLKVDQPLGVRSGHGAQDPVRFRAVAQRRSDRGGLPARRRRLSASRRVGGRSRVSSSTINAHPARPGQGYPHWTRGDDRRSRSQIPDAREDPDYD